MKTRDSFFNNGTQPERTFRNEIYEKEWPGFFRRSNRVEVNKLYVKNKLDRTKENSKYAFVVVWQMHG